MGEQLVFIIQGFGLVLVVLALLWLLSAVLGRFFIAREQRAAARTTAPAPPAVGAAPAPMLNAGAGAGLPPAHVAAISAAVAVATSGRGRVVRVVAPAHGAAGWSGSGRTAHAQDHRIRAGRPEQARLTASRRPAPTAIAEDAR